MSCDCAAACTPQCPQAPKPSKAPVDPYLLASKLAEDSVLAYHTALAFYGKAYSVHRRFTYLTATTPRPFRFRGDEFLAVKFPKRFETLGRQPRKLRTPNGKA